jgi:hypothetical protein
MGKSGFEEGDGKARMYNMVGINEESGRCGGLGRKARYSP